ncbi:hypothetical protein P5767_003890 [Citrobacter freundii]
MTTNNHPAHGPVSLDRLHQIREILSKAAAQSDGGNLGYAMADAVKVIAGVIAAFGAEPVAWLHSDNGIGIPAITRSRNIADSWLSKGWDIKPLYTSPPAPVVPEWTNEQCLEFLSIAFRHAEIKGDLELDDIRLGMKMVNESRDAMLQAGNSPVIGIDLASEPDRSVEVRYLAPPGYVIVPIVPTEDMIINGFESVPDPHFSDEKEWEEYEALSGCRQAARRAELCWAAMIKAAPKLENF